MGGKEKERSKRRERREVTKSRGKRGIGEEGVRTQKRDERKEGCREAGRRRGREGVNGREK